MSNVDFLKPLIAFCRPRNSKMEKDIRFRLNSRGWLVLARLRARFWLGLVIMARANDKPHWKTHENLSYDLTYCRDQTIFSCLSKKYIKESSRYHNGDVGVNVTWKVMSTGSFNLHRHFSKWTRLLCQMEVNPSGVEFLRTLSKFRKRKKLSSLLFYVLYKSRNLAFSRCSLAVTGWQRNVEKILPHVQLCLSYSKYCYILTFSMLSLSWHLKLPDINPAQETSPCKNVTTR